MHMNGGYSIVATHLPIQYTCMLCNLLYAVAAFQVLAADKVKARQRLADIQQRLADIHKELQ